MLTFTKLNDNFIKDFEDFEVLKGNPELTTVYFEKNPVTKFPSYRMKLT
jgi:hypothetical protein